MNSELLRIVQFIVISGKKIFKVVYKLGEYFFIIIFINCIIDVIIVINRRNCKKVKFIFKIFVFDNKYLKMNQLIGMVIFKMKIMVKFKLKVVLIDLEIVR